MDRKDLKIQALLEKLGSVVTNYEDQVANLRVELTVVSQELEEARAKAANLDGKDETEVQEETTD